MAIIPHHADSRVSGYTMAFFAFDIGFQIDLDAAESLVNESTRRPILGNRRPAPKWFDYSPPPLCLTVKVDPITVGGHTTELTAELRIYDFGAVLMNYKLALPESLAQLPAFAEALHDDTSLVADARVRVAKVLDAIRNAVQRPKLAEAVEDYTVFAITQWDRSVPLSELVDSSKEVIAMAIEGEQVTLAPEQVRRATESTMAYAQTDCAIVDWNAAVLFDADPDDVVSVLQHANVELLELRVLDQELDEILDHADETLAKLISTRFWPSFAAGAMLRRTASAQTDATVLFEGVNNAIKILGNQYLARFYRLAASRLDLPAWQTSVQRKLDASENLYQKMSDSTSTRRLEVLEWVIIVLITISIVLPFTPWYH